MNNDLQYSVGLDPSPLEEGATLSERAIQKIVTKTQDLQSFSERAGRALVGLWQAASGSAVIGFFKDVFEHAGQLQDAAERIGTTTDSLQALDFAVRQAGGTTEMANAVWEKSKKAFDALAAGEEAATKNFAKLHLAANDFVGLGMDDALGRLAKAYSDNRDEAGAFDAITDILGTKTAPRLNAMLLQLGEQGMPAFIAAAKEAGQVMSESTIKRCDELGDRIDALKGRFVTWGSAVIGVVFKVADVLGAIAGNVVNVIQGLETSTISFEEKAGKAEAAIKKIVPPVKEVTDYAKKLQDILDKQNAIIDAQIPKQQQIAKLSEEYFRLHDKAKDAALTEAQRQQLKLDMENVHLKVLGLQKEVNADIAKADKDADAAKQKAYKEHQDAADRLAKLTFERMTLDQQIAKLAKEEQEIAGNLNQAKREGKDTTDLQVSLMRTQNELAAKRKEAEGMTKATIDEQLALMQKQGMSREQIIALLRQQGASEDEIIRKLAAQTAELEKQYEIKRRGTEYERQSDAALEGVVARLKSELDRLVQKNAALPVSQRDPGEAFARSEYLNALNALNERKTIRGLVNRTSEDTARRTYGDTAVDQAIRDMKNEQTRTRMGIEELLAAFQRSIASTPK